METRAVLGYPVHLGSPEELITGLKAGLAGGQHQHVVTLNPEMLMAGDKDPRFGGLLKNASLILPDGAGVVWALKRKKLNVSRVPGIEFSERLMAEAAKEGWPIALIGAAPEVNEATIPNLQQRFPGLNIAYAHHGFFSSPEHREQVAQVCADAKPKIVFVALGVPGQEFWIDEFKPRFTEPCIFVGVGGSFDVWSGLKQRAPELFLKLNLEWLYRITSEPWRLKRVYKTLPMFVVKVILNDNN